MKTLFRTSFFALLTSYIVSSCTTIDLYEKSAAIPGHTWKNSYVPSFTFSIKDTNAVYQPYLIIRHNDKYGFNNIYLNLYCQAPGQPEKKITLDLPLATDEKGWLASGMDDIYEHRIAFVIDPQILDFKKSGTYTFRTEQIMREDPLQNVMNIGLRIEKKQ
ncbi:MAG: gliding motility lipoprotein GldH [Chitinophagaceae bacterium]